MQHVTGFVTLLLQDAPGSGRAGRGGGGARKKGAGPRRRPASHEGGVFIRRNVSVPRSGGYKIV